MVLAQVAEVAVQLLHALLVRLGAFALQALVELDADASAVSAAPLLHARAVGGGRGEQRTRFRLRSSCRSSASVLPARGGVASPSPRGSLRASVVVGSSFLASLLGGASWVDRSAAGSVGLGRFFLWDLETLEEAVVLFSFRPPETAAV